jgi:hypothetical protein
MAVEKKKGKVTSIQKHMRAIGSRGGKATAKKHPKKLARWGKKGARAVNQRRKPRPAKAA